MEKEQRKREKILLVDDSRAVRQLVKLVLMRDLPCTIEEAADGQEAVEKLGAASYDLMITDINMPRMDGLSLIKTVRREMKINLPIIIVTTKGREADRDAGLEMGADSYVTKPINASRLLHEAKALMA